MIYIASDHVGINLKLELKKALPNLPWEDLGTESKDSVDYPDFADQLAKKLTDDKDVKSFGVLICGSGQGMAIRANRYGKVRAALCWNPEIAQLSRQHNDANVLCLPGRFLTTTEAIKIFEIFQNTNFEGGRHSQRVAKLSKPLDNP